MMHDRHGVDEKPDHALDPGQALGTAGNDGAEYYVATVGEPAEHNSPGEKHCGVEREAVSSRPFA